jgi:hypothetical protein
MKSRNWLGCHRWMFSYYGGVSHVTVPDCLKTGVVKCHLYDPDLNEDYAYLAAHFSTAIVPARVRKPNDKAIAEGLVRILSRYFRFRFRRSRFTSIAEINRALMVCIERINDQTHRCFGVSRRERFEKIERAALKALPSVEYDGGEWKSAKLHPDCYVAVEGDYYSAPHIHRHKKLRIKLTEHHVEIFLNLERLAIHPRSAESGAADQDPRALPRELDRVLRGDAPETIVAVALHPSRPQHAVPRAVQRRRLRSSPPRHGLGLRMHEGNQSFRPRPGERTHRHRHRDHAPLQPHPHAVLPGSADPSAQTVHESSTDPRDRAPAGQSPSVPRSRTLTSPRNARSRRRKSRKSTPSDGSTTPVHCCLSVKPESARPASPRRSACTPERVHYEKSCNLPQLCCGVCSSTALGGILRDTFNSCFSALRSPAWRQYRFATMANAGNAPQTS